jgi:hypothetical protein
MTRNLTKYSGKLREDTTICENNIKFCLGEIGFEYMDWIQVAQDGGIL